MSTSEANFDGLVGPTHNYAGLSYGNLASTQHGGSAANPRAAALQGLEKMKALHDLGLVQGVLPPQERPFIPLLRRLGVSGRSDAAVLERAHAIDPTLLALASSASAMWTANAATVAPSADTSDGRTHFVVANLQRKLHRAIEPPATFAALSAIFGDADRFCVHPPLPSAEMLGDEGAANHTRLAREPSALGVHLFVYGRSALRQGSPAPSRFPARQTLEASQAAARLMRLLPDRCVFLQQNPAVIDAGVFHNDVIAVGHGRTLFHHEDAFLEPDAAFATLDAALEGLTRVVVPRDAVSVEDAVRSYLFNSQLVKLPGAEGHLLIAPAECERVPRVAAWLDAHVGPGQPIAAVRFFDLRESMQNGGGPACLRLRVVLGSAERSAANPAAFLDDDRYAALVDWVERHYRDRLAAEDLADPALLEESRAALDELTVILGLGSLYDFQRAAGVSPHES